MREYLFPTPPPSLPPPSSFFLIAPYHGPWWLSRDIRVLAQAHAVGTPEPLLPPEMQPFTPGSLLAAWWYCMRVAWK